MRTVIFDLDGTLADTSADLIAAANATLRGLGGAPLDPAGDRAVAFAGGRAMLRAGLARAGLAAPEGVIEAAYGQLLDHYRAGIAVETRLHPGAAAAVEGLRAAGFRTGICTNKPVELARALLAALGARDLFDGLVGAGSLAARKPDPAPYCAAVAAAGGAVARSFLVGDTVTDRDTARAAGVPVALVTFGPEGRGVATLAPDALLDDFAALGPLARRLTAGRR
ncbi:MAG: HAD hydrolase-like protein [Rhodobacteraceae bacterium]|nr:HAD hydrolase-like protein [Paracoccaceae bacterium]